jgi:hypothetical protein
MTDDNVPFPIAGSDSGKKDLPQAAVRALEEAAQRRAAQAAAALAVEHDGPKGVEPTRFGDWERKGIAYDF